MRPERIVHIGLGAFFKAHQAWYTQHAPDSSAWGIVAYTGRAAKAADDLTAGGNKYTLVTRFKDRDEYETIDSVVRAESAENMADLIKTVSNPNIALVTLTITEAGYQVDSEKELAQSALGRLTLALDQRRIQGAGSLALVPCDNMPDNGKVLKAALASLGQQLGKSYLEYLEQLSFVSTSVDRITPKLTSQDQEQIKNKLGKEDLAAVVTEPFSDWVLSGDFPFGRPAWEKAGAKFVSEIEPFENRKLWLLNGAHTLMALTGLIRNLATVHESLEDATIAASVKSWWKDASSLLESEQLNLDQYLEALGDRFSNSRISHQLEQIAKESITKLQVRIVPVAEKLLAEGIVSKGAVAAVAAYLSLVNAGHIPEDSKISKLQQALGKPDTTLSVLEMLSAQLVASDLFREAVITELEKLQPELQTKN
jgi:fructuronate reductase